MRFIKNIFKKFFNWVNSGYGHNEDNDDDVWASPNTTIGSRKHRPLRTNEGISDTELGFHFTIFPAAGGKVLQLYTYDKNMDRRPAKLYIISDKDDLGTELSQILTVECLLR